MATVRRRAEAAPAVTTKARLAPRPAPSPAPPPAGDAAARLAATALLAAAPAFRAMGDAKHREGIVAQLERELESDGAAGVIGFFPAFERALGRELWILGAAPPSDVAEAERAALRKLVGASPTEALDAALDRLRRLAVRSLKTCKDASRRAREQIAQARGGKPPPAFVRFVSAPNEACSAARLGDILRGGSQLGCCLAKARVSGDELREWTQTYVPMLSGAVPAMAVIAGGIAVDHPEVLTTGVVMMTRFYLERVGSKLRARFDGLVDLAMVPLLTVIRLVKRALAAMGGVMGRGLAELRRRVGETAWRWAVEPVLRLATLTRDAARAAYDRIAGGLAATTAAARAAKRWFTDSKGWGANIARAAAIFAAWAARAVRYMYHLFITNPKQALLLARVLQKLRDEVCFMTANAAGLSDVQKVSVAERAGDYAGEAAGVARDVVMGGAQVALRPGGSLAVGIGNIVKSGSKIMAKGLGSLPGGGFIEGVMDVVSDAVAEAAREAGEEILFLANASEMARRMLDLFNPASCARARVRREADIANIFSAWASGEGGKAAKAAVDEAAV